MAEALLSKETLNYEEVEALLGPPPFGKKKLIGPEEFEVGVNDEAGVPKTSTAQDPVPATNSGSAAASSHPSQQQ